MSETIEQPDTTVSNIAIDKSYLLGALKSFDSNILEKKYSFKVDGTNIEVPALEDANKDIIFQYIGSDTNVNNLQYGYFYKVIRETGITLKTYSVTDDESIDPVYLYKGYLWTTTDNATYSPINGAKFSEITKEGIDTIVYDSHEYAIGNDVTGTLSGYLAINTQPDAAEPIKYYIKKNTEISDSDASSNIVYELWQNENGVDSAVADSVIEIPKQELLSNASVIHGVHEDAGQYLDGDNNVIPEFTEADYGNGNEDTYLQFIFHVKGYLDADTVPDTENDVRYLYVPVNSLIDETDFGYGLTLKDGAFNVTTQVLALPGSDKAEGEERQTYLSTYANNENNPKVVQLATNGLFYELVENDAGTYEWKYIAPVIFNEENISFIVGDFQIGHTNDSGTYDHSTTDAGAGEGSDSGDGPDIGD